MHLSILSLFVGGALVAAAGDLFVGETTSFMAMNGLFERQVRFCAPVPAPATCERSCGPGYVTCINLPHCYNPGLGQVCCSNGRYCDAGFYCTNIGCCRNGRSLSECGAVRTLSVIPPPAATTGAPAKSATSPAAAATTTTSAVVVVPTVAVSTETAIVETPTTVETPTIVAGTSAVASTTKAAVATGTSTAGSSTLSTTASPSPSIRFSSVGVKECGSLLTIAIGGLGVYVFLV